MSTPVVVWGFHTSVAYSSVGRTKLLFALFFTSFVHGPSVLSKMTKGFISFLGDLVTMAIPLEIMRYAYAQVVMMIKSAQWMSGTRRDFSFWWYTKRHILKSRWNPSTSCLTMQVEFEDLVGGWYDLDQNGFPGTQHCGMQKGVFYMRFCLVYCWYKVGITLGLTLIPVGHQKIHQPRRICGHLQKQLACGCKGRR